MLRARTWIAIEARAQAQERDRRSRAPSLRCRDPAARVRVCEPRKPHRAYG